MSTIGPLSDEHVAMLRASAIPDDVIRQRGYRTVTDKKVLLALGFKDYQALVPCLLIPIIGVNGEIVGHHIRPDVPRTTTNGKPKKYEFPGGCSNRIDLPPSVCSMIGNPSVPLWVTEGSKKADCAAGKGLCCINLIGVWNWRGKNKLGGSTAIGDWESVALKNREVYIAFDSDSTQKDSVKQAEARLAEFLRSRGARVSIVRIPPGANGEKVGLDDYFAADGSVERLMANAVKPEAAKNELGDICNRTLQLVEEAGVELWHDNSGEPFASFQPAKALIHAPVRSKGFEGYVRGLYYKANRRGLSDQACSQVLGVLVAMAVYEGLEYEVERRVGWHDSKVFLALYDEIGRVVEISADGWKIIDQSDSPIRFVKPVNALSLPEPRRGGTLDLLRPLINVGQDEWPLVTAVLVGFFLPTGTFPVTVVTGGQGAGKSFGSTCLRGLVDPQDCPLRGVPKSNEDFMAALKGGYILAFDNLSGLSEENSDRLCRIASGGGFASRTLWTNAEETVVKARRPIIFNGIGVEVARGDLADRSILLRFRPLNTAPRAERDLKRQYESVLPEVLGALLDRAVRAVAGCESEPDTDLRLADFAQFAMAACESSDAKAILLKALVTNRAELQGAAIENDEFAQALVALVQDEGEVVATPAELLTTVNRRRKDVRQFSGGWPRDAAAVGRLLPRLVPALQACGIRADQLPRQSTRKAWRFRDISVESSRRIEPVLLKPCDLGESRDGCCDGLPTLEVEPSSGLDNDLSLEQPRYDGSDGCDGSDSSLSNEPVTPGAETSDEREF